MKLKEFDTRKEAKQRAEFITPPALREFIAKKVKGDNLNILDTSIGSGQLLFNLKERNKKKKRRQSIEMENYLNSQKELIYSMLKDDATIKKIAEATGVSSKTISKYMSESEILKPKKKN